MSHNKTVVACRNPHCRQRLNVPLGLGALTLTCPKCRHRWDWDPHADARRRVRAAWATAVLLALGVTVLWWRGSQASDLERWGDRLSHAELRRSRGALPDAEQERSAVEGALANSGPCFPTLRADRDRVRADLRSLRERVDESKRQRAALDDASEQLRRAATAVRQKNLAAATEGLGRVRAALLDADGWERAAETREQRSRLRADADALQPRIDELAYVDKLRGALARARAVLSRGEFAQAVKAVEDEVAAFGGTEPVLAEVRKFVAARCDSRDWGAEQERVLDAMLADAVAWRGACNANRKSGYSDFVAKHPTSPFAQAAEAKLIELEVRDQMATGRYQPLPDAPGPIRRDASLSHGVNTLHNDTQYTLTVLFHGPEARRVTLPPSGSQDVTLSQGVYTVSASASDPSVLPFIGSRTIQNGDILSERFYIVTRRRPR